MSRSPLFPIFFQGMFHVPEPGIAPCSKCGHLYTPTPLSLGRCERCRRPEGCNAVDYSRVKGHPENLAAAEENVRQFPASSRKRVLGRGLDALLPEGLK